MHRVAAALTMLLLLGAIAPPRTTFAQAQDPGAVIDAFEAAARSGDVERALGFLAPNAVLTGVSGRAYTGLQEIRGRLALAEERGEYLISGPGTRQIAGNRVTWTQLFFAPDLRDLGVAPMVVTTEAVIEGGRISQLTYRPTAESEQRLRIATSTQETMQNLQQTMAAHDLVGTVALFAENAVAQTPVGTFTGRAEVQRWLQSLFDGGFQEQIIGPRQVAGDRVIQHADFELGLFKALGIDSLSARVEATIPEGRISRLDVILDPASEARLQSAMNRAIVVRFLNEINAGNLGIIDTLLAPDFVDYDVPAGMDAGIEGARAFFAMIRKAFPDVAFTPTLVTGDGDLVVVRSVITGTNIGPLMGMPPSGASISVPGIDILRVRDGRIVEHWGVADELSLLRQLGVIPPMP